MINKHDELTAIDCLNKASKYLWNIQDVAGNLSALGMDKAADKLFDSLFMIRELLDQARGDISESISTRYNESINEVGNILKTCLEVAEKDKSK